MSTNTFDPMALAILLVLLVAVPLIGVWDWRRLIRWTEDGHADARLKSYNWIFAMEWGLTLGLLSWWLLDGRDLASLGLVPAAGGWQWLAIGVGLVGVVVMILQMLSVLRNPEKLEQIRAEMGELSLLAPQSPAEDRRFAMLAVTAGVCEEILYRGMLLAVLIPVTGIWPAVALNAVIFGLGHAYQGLSGIVKTALVGLIMALLTVFSGSLFVAILLHAVIDLASGRMVGQALRQN